MSTIYWLGYVVCVAVLIIAVINANKICRGVREPEGEWEVKTVNEWNKLIADSPDMSEDAKKMIWMLGIVFSFAVAFTWPILAVIKVWKRL